MHEQKDAYLYSKDHVFHTMLQQATKYLRKALYLSFGSQQIQEDLTFLQVHLRAT